MQQRENLHGLAEPHVVGQAHAELEGMQKGEPAHALFLIGPKFRLEGRPQRYRRGRLGKAHLRHDRFEPLAAADRNFRINAAGIEKRFRIELKPERIAEGKTLAPCQRAGFFVSSKRLPQFFRVHGHPAVLDQGKPFRGFEQFPGLIRGYRSALDMQPDIEAEQGVHPYRRRLPVSHRDVHLQAC